MKKLIKLRKWLDAQFYGLDHDQRKQVASVLNNIATLIVVQYFFRHSGINAVMMLMIAVALWLISVKIVRIVRKDKE